MTDVPIPGFSNYTINEHGQVFDLITKAEIHPTMDHRQRYSVLIKGNGWKTTDEITYHASVGSFSRKMKYWPATVKTYLDKHGAYLTHELGYLGKDGLPASVHEHQGINVPHIRNNVSVSP